MYVTVFKSNHWCSHIPSSWMVHAWCVFVAGIHPSRTRTSGSFESVRWNACMHRLDLGLYSYPKDFWGNEVRTHVNSKGKITSTGKNSPQGRIEPTTLHQAGQRAQDTANEVIQPCFLISPYVFNGEQGGGGKACLAWTQTVSNNAVAL